ncbi:uncharacterized protein LOC123562170 [Mercenaria mercenaria]|uniref:uncharacterized protein LOC123562170 n=1 Tax=Mercenaria mercenaria TaxID=6596 RepID=UPI00234F6807|nr:uncharacterized protein LOC123562170 [Mercenaria mercenaria]
MARQSSLSQTSVLIFIAYCFYNLTCFGRLFDDSKSANYYELTRCVLFLVGEMAACKLGLYGEKGYRPWFMHGFQWCFAFSVVIWIAQILTAGNAKEEIRHTEVHAKKVQ